MNQIMNQIKAGPMAGSCATGLIASLCCGGSLIFASMGLGSLWSLFGLSRFIPQALAAGALAIVAINYFFYRRAAERISNADDRRILELRQGMFLSAALGLAAMAASFVFLEWFNHAAVNPDRFLAHSEYGQALIPGVPNVRLLYAVASFAALALLWALPFPNRFSATSHNEGWVKWAARVAVFGAATVLIIGAVVDASAKFGAPGDGHGAPARSHGSPGSSQHGQAH